MSNSRAPTALISVLIPKHAPETTMEIEHPTDLRGATDVLDWMVGIDRLIVDSIVGFVKKKIIPS